MVRFLICVFDTERFTIFDLLAFVAGSLLGGWLGLAVFVVLLFAGSFIAGFARAWRRDKRAA